MTVRKSYSHHWEISDTAAHDVRLNFNPSQDDTVHKIKCMTAGLITLLEDFAAAHNAVDDAALVELLVAAKNQIITASMWSVLTVTAKK